MGLFSFLTKEIAIDLGTANTIIIYNDKVVVDEPSIVAMERNTGRIIAVGKKAMLMHGKTHENRKLLMLQIGSPSNLDNLEDIQKRHLQVVDPNTNVTDFKDLPLFINLAYGVHGNEPSSTEAAPVLARQLWFTRKDSSFTGTRRTSILNEIPSGLP